MAYEPYADPGGVPTYQDTYSDTSTSAGNPLARLTNVAGAVASVALVIGVGIWGYKLMVRDVSGIPVVRAMEGEMRVRPDNPGGDLAQHQGLAVNQVAADGGAAAPADRLVLAPQPVELTEEDMPMDDQAVAIVQQAIADQARDAASQTPVETVPAVDPARVAAAAETGSVEDLVAVLTEGLEPLEQTGIAGGPEVVVQAAATAPIDAALLEAPGVKTSIRPRLRPVRPVRAVQAEPAVATTAQASLAATRPQQRRAQPLAATPQPASFDPNNLPAGTRLVQLGAYDSIDIAQVEWAKFSARFADLMVGKKQIVQEASSGGRNFYRLRAMGFDDLSAARRFCSALVAEGADCIPVVTR